MGLRMPLGLDEYRPSGSEPRKALFKRLRRNILKAGTVEVRSRNFAVR